MVRKHTVTVAGHPTSLTLEDLFWSELNRLAKANGQSVNQLVSDIDARRQGNLCSAVRVYVLQQALAAPHADGHSAQSGGLVQTSD